MKNIAVLIHSLTSEYCIDVLNAISSFFEGKDVRLFIYQSRNPVNNGDDFDYSDWLGVDCIKSEQIDAIILVSGSYLALVDGDFLPNHLKKLENKTVVSMAMDYNAPNVYYTHTECESTYDEVVKHLKEKHGCKNFAFVSARLTHSIEGKERFDAFVKALKNNNLEYKEELIFDGRFTQNSAKEALEKVIKSKDDVNFDAILCANDVMALGTQNYLRDLGVKIPEQVRIFGFDETSYAAGAYPKISTINQDVSAHAYKVAEMVYRIVNGEDLPKKLVFSVEPVYRQSCGCIPLTDNDNVFLNRKLEYCRKSEAEMRILNNIGHHFNFLEEIDNLNTVFDMTNSVFTLEKIFYTIKYLMINAGMTAMAVCFFDEPVSLSFDKDFELPESMRVSMIIDNDDDILEYEPGIIFNPHKYFLPENIFNNHNGNYIIQPIFSGNKCYGYLVCRLNKRTFDLYTVFLKIFINTLAQAYEYTNKVNENVRLSEQNVELQHNNSNLDEKSKTDELTSLLNRRGLFETGQKTIEIAMESNANGLVLFADMDNLKKINDNYGHKIGDEAIQAMAEALRRSLRANDVIGRISGDEFAVIAVGMKMENLPQVRKKMKITCKKISKAHKFAFQLSFSVGAVEFNSQKNNITELLSAADENLYEEKKIKHPKESVNVKKRFRTK